MYDMDWEWNDRVYGLESELVRLEQVISGARARQAEILSQLDRMQVDLSDGDRGMEDWTAAHLDVSPQTAHRLMTIAHSEDRWLLEQFKAGRFGLDRASHLVKLAATGCPTDLFLEAADDYSLGRLWGLVEQRREVSATHEQSSFESRYLVIQPSLDESMFKLWGQLYGLDGEMVDKALRQKADEFPNIPGQSQGQLLADALTAVCADSLTGSSEPGKEGRAVTVAEIFVDANLAAPTFGEAGVTTSSGLRVGPATLAEILCEGRIRVVYSDGDKGPIAITHQTEAIPPAIRAWVFHRDQGQCSIEGCRSRHRIQIHHIHEQHLGGDHHPANLITLCWYHHHIVIHQLGMTIDPNSPIHRRRLIGWRPTTGPPISFRPLLSTPSPNSNSVP
ncbi:MAG: HNH endonuclease [Acidimicrobiia bacterium]